MDIGQSPQFQANLHLHFFHNNAFYLYPCNNEEIEEDIVVFYLLKSIFREKNKEIFIILLRRWFEYINLHFNLLLMVYLV